MRSVLQIVYIVIGFLQFFAVWDSVMELFDIGSILGFIIGGFLTFVPLIGAGLGIYGATEVWDWSFIQAFLLFGWQFVLLALMLIGGASAAIASGQGNPKLAHGHTAPSTSSTTSQRTDTNPQTDTNMPTKMKDAHIELAQDALALGLELTARKDTSGKYDPTIRQACFCWGFCDALTQQAGAGDAEAIAFIAMVFNELFGEKCAPLIGDITRHEDEYSAWIIEGGNALINWQRSDKPPIPPGRDD